MRKKRNSALKEDWEEEERTASNSSGYGLAYRGILAEKGSEKKEMRDLIADRCGQEERTELP